MVVVDIEEDGLLGSTQHQREIQRILDRGPLMPRGSSFGPIIQVTGMGEVDYSQGLPTLSGDAPYHQAAGIGQATVPTRRTAIFEGLLLTVASALGLIFIIKALPVEKNPIWQVVGYTAMSGAGFGALFGVSRILDAMAPESKPEEKA